MSSLLWDKGKDIDARIMAFCAADDVILDRALFLFDISASRAHAEGLARIGLLDEEELAGICHELTALASAFEAGEFVLDERYEDGHSAIEAWLTDKLGVAGKKVHLGRSRNDQVLVATRLYLIDVCDRAVEVLTAAARAALERSAQTANVPMPGYTHLQRAVPSTLGMWFAGFAEAFIDDARLIKMTRAWINANPLGTAAGYGVNVALDRQATGEALGFTRMQVNPIYAQNSRGKFALQVLSALGQAMLDVRRLAWDLSLFTTAEFRFADLPDAFTTGSSIMPNKRNPDVVELLRAAYAIIPGATTEIQQVLSLPSGYHRDLQATKGPMLRACQRSLDALALVERLIEHSTFDVARMREAISAPMYATDLAVELATSGVPFREAYRQVADSLDELDQRDPDDSIRARTSPGACHDLMLDELDRRLDSLQGK